VLREGRAGLLLLSVCALSLLNATAPLNPTVKIRKHSSTPLPAECDESVAPQPSPRIQMAEAAPEPVPVAARPGSVRELLQETQAAAARGDRDGFNDALARLKATPDHAMADNVIRVYDDLGRLWTYEFETSSGAFFDASNDLLRMLSAYPGYGKAVEEQTLTAGGTKLYPSRESRDFLVREGASRLAKLGLAKTPAPPVTVAVARKPKEKPRTTTTTTTVVEKKQTVHHPRVKKSRGGQAPTPVPVPKVAEKKRQPKPAPTPVPAPVPAPVPTTTTQAPTPRPAPVPAPVPTTTTQAPVATTTTAPPPVTTTTAAAATTDTTPTTATAATDTASTQTTATETTATEAPQQPQQPKSPMRNVILPIILIVIGVGVLIVLFRASS